jgi:hypothetical protein
VVTVVSMVVPVWVDDWQQQCCGDDYSIGDEVAWTLIEADDGVEAVLGDAFPDWTVEVRPDPVGPAATGEQERVVLRRGGLAILAAPEAGRARSVRMPAEERHTDFGDAPRTVGRVRCVRYVHCALVPVGDEPNVWAWAPASAVVTDNRMSAASLCPVELHGVVRRCAP